ncbi:sensor domain-containing phosphodiesterase [Luteimonas saliphila]|uniref:sensor domain-containing phosphodiesterase n=1 Tax=Luteimonas saliphila TaxID=2804919 RepID=UPI00192DD5F8|nr:EAL domain-containing protein [Luteimonas saliphila]
MQFLVDKRRRRAAPGADALSDAEALALLTRVVEAQGAIMASGPGPSDVLAALTVYAQELTGAEGAVLEIRDGDAMVYWFASGMAEARLGLRIPVAGSLSGLSMERGCVLRCDDSEEDARVDRDACRRVGLRSMVVVPLQFRDQPVGVLKVASCEPHRFGPAETLALEHLATLAGASLHRAVEASRQEAEVAGRAGADADRDSGDAAAQRRLTEVLGEGRLRVARQPIVRLADRTVVGWEALARFPEEYGLPTDTWFRDAARCGRSVDLELVALRAALRDPLPAGGAYLSLNVSPEVACSDALDDVLGDVDPARIVLEITEHTAVEDYSRLAARLSAFQARGFRIAVDDTGAGFSSLRHVLTLAPDIIKLDMSLVRGVDRHPRLQSLIAALCTFAEGTQATLVAEGVETDAELRMLQQIGVACGQGYFIGAPQLA